MAHLHVLRLEALYPALPALPCFAVDDYYTAASASAQQHYRRNVLPLVDLREEKRALGAAEICAGITLRQALQELDLQQILLDDAKGIQVLAASLPIGHPEAFQKSAFRL